MSRFSGFPRFMPPAAPAALRSPATRREFLRRASAFGALGTAAPWALNLATLSSASAAVAGDYKALVCVFLYGGNDAYNMVLPTDSASWAAYTTTRNQAPEPISLLAPGTVADSGAAAGSPARLGGVLALNAPLTDQGGRSFALHPQLGGLQGLFNAQRLGIVANVGPLIRPTTKTDYANASFPKPAKLFSHNDQQSTWQSFAPEGSTAGWGGRLADTLLSSNASAPLFSAVSATGNAVWLSGHDVLQYQVSPSGLISVGATSMFGSTSTSPSSGPIQDADKSVYATMTRLLRQPGTAEMLAQDYTAVGGRALDAESQLKSHLQAFNVAPWGTTSATSAQADPLLQYTSPLTGASAFNSLAQQLQVVARMIQAGSDMGLKRQVFMVSLGGFDTHDNQNRSHADLYAKLNHGLIYFDSVLQSLGASNLVTTFTASDFGRTFTSNGDGTDHGWGSHHFVLGGAVRGGDIYGSFPQYSVADASGNFSSLDQLRNGVMLPSTSVDQYAYTLARWFGVGDGDLLGSSGILPNLGNFNSGARNLGFV